MRKDWIIQTFLVVVLKMIKTHSSNAKTCYHFIKSYITPSHYHHCANLSLDIELMKYLPDIFCRVCEQDWAYSLSFPLFNIWGCMFSVYPIPSWWLREYIALSYHHHQIGSITNIHCLGLGHETIVCAVCLFIFLFFLNRNQSQGRTVILYNHFTSLQQACFRLNSGCWSMTALHS